MFKQVFFNRKKIILLLAALALLMACSREGVDPLPPENPVLELTVPPGFPELNPSVKTNIPTRYGAELGKRLFFEKKFSAGNTISCASCHQPSRAFTDGKAQATGVEGRIGLRNTPPLQNMAFLKFYNWDGNVLQLEKQPLVPIITKEEMNSSILEVISKIKEDAGYKILFQKAFGDESITPDRIYKSIAQYGYTLISANSKYDRVKRNEGESFTAGEARGYAVFQQKCNSCHSSELFTDQSFRNIGFPINTHTSEAGRARVTGLAADYMSFRVPSLRNVQYTAPYGSFGQFATLRSVLDYLDAGVIDSENLDPVLKQNGGRIPLSEEEKESLIAFMNTLSDTDFLYNFSSPFTK